MCLFSKRLNHSPLETNISHQTRKPEIRIDSSSCRRRGGDMFLVGGCVKFFYFHLYYLEK